MPTPYDFLEIYYPKSTEVDLERVRLIRSRQALAAKAAYPDIDTSPNSPFGDLNISPGAFMSASVEEAFNRFLSDLDPENVAGGTAWNCRFLEKYLPTFGVYDNRGLGSYGVLRLQFVSADTVEIDRSTTFRINDGLYRPYLPFAGPLQLIAPGATPIPGINSRNFYSYSPTSWVVDLLIEGVSGTVAAGGSTAEVDRTIEGLSAAALVTDIRAGSPPLGIQEMARRTRDNFYSRTPVTAGSAINMIRQRFPEITAVSCAVSGDPEQTRDQTNPFQVAAGKIDLYVRDQNLLTDSVVVDLPCLPIDSSEDRKFVGMLLLPETPIRILSIAYGDVMLDPTLYSISTDPLKPGLSAAYGRSEQLLVAAPMPVDEELNPLVILQTDSNAQLFGRFVVTYQFDGNLKAVQEFLQGEDNVPVGLDLYVRWFCPAIVESLRVSYNRKAGVQFSLEQARKEILAAYNTQTPDTPATPALLADSLYYAGAHSVEAVTMTAQLHYSLADKVWLGSVFEIPVDEATWGAFEAETLDTPLTEITTAYEPEVNFVDTALGTFAASGKRNVSWLMDAPALSLVELRSL
jgi:hypothetical protein